MIETFEIQVVSAQDSPECSVSQFASLIDAVTNDLHEAAEWIRSIHMIHPPQIYSTIHQHPLVFRLLYRRCLAGVTLAISSDRLRSHGDWCDLFDKFKISLQTVARALLDDTKANCCDALSESHFRSWIHPSVSELLELILRDDMGWEEKWHRSLLLLP